MHMHGARDGLLRNPLSMLGAFAKLIADETYGGAVYSMTPNEDWKEVTGEDANPNLITPEKYQELVDAYGKHVPREKRLC